MSHNTGPSGTTPLPQGDTRLLETDVARGLLASNLYARVAYVARDGSPRVVPSWFTWTGGELVMPTFIAAPHVAHPSRRLADLRARPTVAVTIDTDAVPPHVLLLRGDVTVDEVDGVDPDYAVSARRYLGEEAAGAYIEAVDQPGTRMARIALRPSWVGVLDFVARQPGALRS
jgi:hypothetical protein